jgi:ribosomal protein L36
MKQKSNKETITSDVELQLRHLRVQITRLECYQLAESVIAVEKCSKVAGKRLGDSISKHHPGTSKYLVTFDKVVGINPILFDKECLSKLAKARIELLVSSGALDTGAQTINFNTNSTSLKPEETSMHRSLRKQTPKEITNEKKRAMLQRACKEKIQNGSFKSETPAIKQLDDLLDEKCMGKIINYEIYAICHHCKIIRNKGKEMVKCTYSSFKDGKATPACITANGVKLFNGTFQYIILHSRC